MNQHIAHQSTIYHQIKEAGRGLFVTRGFEATSVSDVVELLQITEADFFLYFKSMDELLEVVWSES